LFDHLKYSDILYSVTAIAQRLDEKMREWQSEKSQAVEKLVAEIIEMADGDTLDIGRSRKAEQEVLDMLDET